MDGATLQLGPPPTVPEKGNSLVGIAAYKNVLTVCHMRDLRQVDSDRPSFSVHLSDLLLETGIRQKLATFDLAGPILGKLRALTRRPEEASGSWDITRFRMGIERTGAGADLVFHGTLVPGDDLKPEWRRANITQFHFQATVPTSDLTAIFRAREWSSPEE